jgi:hypothetical protein
MKRYCCQCGTVDRTKTITKGSILIEIGLWLFSCVLYTVCPSTFGQTAFPFRQSEGKYYNVTNSQAWVSIPPRDTYNDSRGVLILWKAKVVDVRTNGIYVQITAEGSSHGSYVRVPDDWNGRRVVIINHPKQSVLAKGETLPPEFFHLVKTVNGVQVYDFGVPYDPMKKLAESKAKQATATNSVTVTNK